MAHTHMPDTQTPETGVTHTQVTDTHSPGTIPDAELLRRLRDILRDSRRTESGLVAHVGEVDRRRLYAREASPSMFVYCTRVLHLSGAEAYLRITAARAARKHPVLLAMLADGRLHLSGIAKLAPSLTRENREAEHDYGRQAIDRHRLRMRDAAVAPRVHAAGVEPGAMPGAQPGRRE